MNKDLDLTEILKDCPNGIKLYSPIFGDVYLDKIRPYLAIVVTTTKEQNSFKEEFFYDGRYGINGECMLFPSKEQRDWSKWQRPFVDGDVIYAKVDDLSYIIIYHKQIDERVYRHVCLCLETNMFGCDKDCIFTDGPIDEWRLATEEEKQKLFDVIKANGYKWNADTKTLEKLIVPKFKVGDVIRSKDGLQAYKITNATSEYYSVKVQDHACVGLLSVVDQDNWILLPNKFDPKTLKPFESKVLVSTFGKWMPAIFGHYNKEHSLPIVVVGGNVYTKCIPYEGNEHLIDTYDQPSEFYRYWED